VTVTDLSATSTTHAPAHRLLAVEQAASYLGVSRATVERLAYRGDLPVVKVGGATRYAIDALDDFIATNRRRRRQYRQ
jgi:excisionase family DNA binding protein